MPAPPETRGTPTSSITPKRKSRLGGFAWIFMGIAALFVTGALISAFRTQRAPTPRSNVPRSNEYYFGAQDFTDVPGGGVTFNNVYPPDGPADKAGLVGGDIIKSIDGRGVSQSKDLVELLKQTPANKTLELIYIRDADTKTTKLTTIPGEQFDALVDKFEDRPGGQGQLGYEDLASRVVSVEGTNISGVKINRLSSSGPAALAGIQEGDIVIEFAGVPIRKRGELIMRVRRAAPYSTVNVVIMRGTQRLEIPVKVGKRG